MRNKKGFTLIELLSVVVVLGIVMVAAFSIFQVVRKNALNKQRDNVIKYLETKAAEYANDTGITTVSVQDLIDAGYVKTDDQTDIYDPTNDKSLNCYIIKSNFENGTYVSTFTETNLGINEEKQTCNSYDKESNYKICILKNEDECEEIDKKKWYNEKNMTLGVIYKNPSDNSAGIRIKDTDAEFNWISSDGKTSTKSTIEFKPDDNVAKQVTYKVEVIMNGKKGEPQETLKIDRQKPEVLSIEKNDNWTTKKEIKIKATDYNGSGIAGYAKVEKDVPCSNDDIIYQKESKFTFLETLNEEIKICVIDNAGNTNDDSRDTDKDNTNVVTIDRIDSKTPTDLEIKANDGKTSEAWHNSSDLENVKGEIKLEFSCNHEGTSKVTYYYGLVKNENGESKTPAYNFSASFINLSESYNGYTIYVKACNESGNCSEPSNYVIKYDITPPKIRCSTDEDKTKDDCKNVTPNLGYIKFKGNVEPPDYIDNISGVEEIYVCVNMSDTISCDPTIPIKDFNVYSEKIGNSNIKYNVKYYLWHSALDIAGNKSKPIKSDKYFDVLSEYESSSKNTLEKESSGSGGGGISHYKCDITCSLSIYAFQNSLNWDEGEGYLYKNSTLDYWVDRALEQAGTPNDIANGNVTFNKDSGRLIIYDQHGQYVEEYYLDKENAIENSSGTKIPHVKHATSVDTEGTFTNKDGTTFTQVYVKGLGYEGMVTFNNEGKAVAIKSKSGQKELWNVVKDTNPNNVKETVEKDTKKKQEAEKEKEEKEDSDSKKTNNSGGNVCLVENTLITLANKEVKKIQDINYDDLLLVWNYETGKVSYEYPIWIEKEGETNEYQLTTFSDGTTLETVGDHAIFSITNNMFVSVLDKENFKIGTKVFKLDKNNNPKGVTVTNIKKIKKKVKYYFIASTRYHNIFANELLTTDGKTIFANLYGFKDYKWNINYQEYIKNDNNLYSNKEIELPNYLYYGFRAGEAKKLEKSGILSLNELKAYIKENLVNEKMLKKPIADNDGNNLWMVTTSDNYNGKINKSNLYKENSLYKLPLVKRNGNKKFIGWYNMGDGKIYKENDYVKVVHGMHFEALWQ